MQELFTELSDTRFALAQAYVRFDNTTEPELVDACIFELNALQSRYNYLLRLVKESGGIAASRIYSEGRSHGSDGQNRHCDPLRLRAFSVVRLFAAPLKLAAKVLLNTALGFLALFLLGLTEPVTGFSLGLNFSTRSPSASSACPDWCCWCCCRCCSFSLHIFGEAAVGRLFHLSSPPTPQP